MKIISKAKLFVGLVLFGSFVTSCSKDGEPVVEEKPVVSDNVSGEVSGTWKKGNTYKVTGHLEIPAGKSLTVEEGVTILMSNSTLKPEIIVKGNLYLLGTGSNPVKVTVPEELKTTANQWGALWGGIIAASTSSEIVINNSEINYGGAVTTEASPSVKAGLYKAAAGEHVPFLYYSNTAGKLVVTNSTISHFNEDGMYIEGGNVIIAKNKFYTTGEAGGESVNLKSGVIADVAFNLMYSPNTNAMKLSNSGERSPQLHIVGYNNTVINAGWRRPTAKGGSLWVEKAAYAELYNNLLVNSRYGIKRDKGNPEDNRSKFTNTFYYGSTETGVLQFQPNTEIIAGTNDVISTVVAANDPQFESYPLNTDNLNAVFNTSWDFHLKSTSPALNKGKTDFTPNFVNGLVVNGVTYKSPAPANYIGAYSTK
ncbi:right-handed parallel beta-helix repeat-containing protein [Desertivirga arenae]|uniref:right-handed parallel beta-helix repeat-containing protein n=1 Tax=Desertivirga arenae TaxID=2810309 RepID=UPI001A963DF2|nr:right-handed parallel beta-helix repeat-containing protein [Pedobacter sp. SYSU D00823]